jgi:hypothetical protein
LLRSRAESFKYLKGIRLKFKLSGLIVIPKAKQSEKKKRRKGMRQKVEEGEIEEEGTAMEVNGWL